MKSLSRILIIMLIFVSCGKMAPVYTLKVSVNPPRSGDVTAIQNPNGTLSLVAYPGADYKFKGWSGSLTGIKNPVIIPFNKNLDITAIFEKITFPFDVAIDGQGTVIIEILSLKSTQPANGSTLRLTPVPDEGWEFAEWTGDLSGKECPAEVTVTQSTNIGCKFVQKKSYPLNMSVTGNGSVTEEVVTLKSNTYVDGTTVELTPVPDEGWEFVEWTGDLTGNANPAQVEVTEATNITCVFQKKSFTVNFTIVGNGTATDMLDNIKTTSYEDGTRIRIDADPNEGWSFVGWIGDITSTDNTVRFNITKTMNITCTFKPDADGDGVIDELDQCPGTPAGWWIVVDENGCADSQKDDDGDGVMNDVDKCSDTPSGEAVDANGCSLSQKTYVPDNNFEQYLINQGWDDVLDDYVRTASIKNRTSMTLQLLNISDLTGIEDFTNLSELTLYDNNFTSLNLSHNLNLTKLTCRWSSLTSLNISSNTNLTYLNCENNQLTSLDLSNNTKLTKLICNSNQLTTLDLTNNINLQNLYCFNNSNLTTLDLSNNTNLEDLRCYQNNMTSLDVSNNTNLVTLYCMGNQLSNLSLSNNVNLTDLNCDRNNISNLDLSQNTKLISVDCDDNNLTSLDLSNNTDLERIYCEDNHLTSLIIGNNTNLFVLFCNNNQLANLDISNNTALAYFECTDNRLTSLDVSNNTALIRLYCENNLLSCIQVNQAQLDAMPGADWTKDGGATYSLSCAPPVY